MPEVEHACSKQQSDAGSEANCPSDEGSGRVESETREPVADASECGRSLQCRETGKCRKRRSVIASHWSTNQGRPYNNYPLFRASQGLCQQLSISGACGKEVTSKRRIKFSGFLLRPRPPHADVRFGSKADIPGPWGIPEENARRCARDRRTRVSPVPRPGGQAPPEKEMIVGHI